MRDCLAVNITNRVTGKEGSFLEYQRSAITLRDKAAKVELARLS